jgi:apolipoprotein N-acyltransferase
VRPFRHLQDRARWPGTLAAVPLRTSAALLAGIALGLTFEPVGLVGLLPFALAAFFCAVRGVSAVRGAALGLGFGLAYMLTVLFWIRVIGTDAWLALSTFEALYLAGLGAGLALVSRLRSWPLLMPVLWVGVEVVRGAWPMGGLTWGRIAFAGADTPYADWLPWVGINGVSLLMALSGGLLAWLAVGLADRRTRRPRTLARRVPVLLGAAVVLCVPMLTSWSGDPAGEFTVAVVQGDVPGDGDDLVAHHREVTRSHVELTQDLARDVAAGRQPQPDLVIWPENTTAVDPFTNESIRQDIQDSARAVGVPVLLGGIVDAPREDQVLNQGIVVSPETGAGDRYTKRHPVPFGEYIPYRNLFGTWTSERLDLVPRDMISGTRVEPLRVDGVEVADLICFDVAYDDTLVDQVTRGADLVVVQTSNALFIHTGQIDQQYEMSRLRALETGRYVVVASVNGRSAVIAPDGDAAAVIEPRTRDVLVERVRLVDGVPLSMWVGPWLGRACVVASVLALAVCLLPYRRTTRAERVRPLETADTGGMPS